VAAQGLEERLEAAADSASEDASVDLDLGDSRGTLELPQRRGAYERDLDPLHGWRLCHHR
jgi:hypothetical protein